MDGASSIKPGPQNLSSRKETACGNSNMGKSRTESQASPHGAAESLRRRAQ